MRTKALLCAAALAAGAVASMAQSNVYSLNVVGYVNSAFPVVGNLYLIGNPLDNTNNDLNTIIPTAPDGTTVLLWAEAIGDFSTLSPQYSTSLHHWNPTTTIAPGQGFYVAPSGPFTNTFIGNVRQNPVTLSVLGNGTLAVLSSTVPLGNGTTNQLAGYPAADGDTVATWNPGTGDFNVSSPQYSTSLSRWNPDYIYGVNEGFFLARSVGPVTWTRTFTVQ